MEFSTRKDLERHQVQELRKLLQQIVPGNSFYSQRLRDARLDASVASLEAFRQRMPFTTKADLVTDQSEHPPYGTDLTFPPGRYVRLHRTSGTTGNHLRWLDTEESWSWMVDGRLQSLKCAGVTASDRVFVAFSFGPFLGFWLIFDAATRLGCLTISGGGLASRMRLEVLLANDSTVLCCTPTYALRLSEVALEAGLDLGKSSVARIFVGGEPGGSVPAVRRQIESRWPGARVFDLHGMTEVGPITYQGEATADYVHVLESSLLCEVVEPETGMPLAEGSEDVGELVLTTLGRAGSPLLRYRTGDLARRCKALADDPDQVSMKLRGGVLGRRDDMVVVRGVNLYPSAVDQLVRSQPGIAEYRVEVSSVRGLTEIELRIEPEGGREAGALARTLEERFRRAYNLRIPVTIAAPQELPRFELKSKRWLRR